MAARRYYRRRKSVPSSGGSFTPGIPGSSNSELEGEGDILVKDSAGKNVRVKERKTLLVSDAYEVVMRRDEISQSSASIEGNDSFYGGTWADAKRQLQFGDDNKKYRDAVFGAMSKIEEMSGSRRMGYQYDTEGDCFDVVKVIEGEPESWLRRVPKDRKTLKIVVAGSYHSGMRHNEIINRGGAIAALVDALRQLYDVELEIVYSAYCASGEGIANKTFDFVVNCGNGMVLDIDKIAFLLANPLAVRRVFCAAMDVSFRDAIRALERDNYGYPVEPEHYGGAEVLYIGMLNNSRVANFVSIEKSVEWVRGEYEKVIEMQKNNNGEIEAVA